jgi:sugar (pentulose or hexulose) kinase
VRPDPGRHARYDEYYRLYRQLYEDNVETMHRLARLAMQSD